MVVNPYYPLMRNRKMYDTFHFERTLDMALLCWDVVRHSIMIQEYFAKICDATDEFRKHAGEEHQAAMMKATLDWQDAKKNRWKQDSRNPSDGQEGTLATSSSHADPWDAVNHIFQEDQIRQIQSKAKMAEQAWQERLAILLMYPEDTDAIAEA